MINFFGFSYIYVEYLEKGFFFFLLLVLVLLKMTMLALLLIDHHLSHRFYFVLLKNHYIEVKHSNQILIFLFSYKENSFPLTLMVIYKFNVT